MKKTLLQKKLQRKYFLKKTNGRTPERAYFKQNRCETDVLVSKGQHSRLTTQKIFSHYTKLVLSIGDHTGYHFVACCIKEANCTDWAELVNERSED